MLAALLMLQPPGLGTPIPDRIGNLRPQADRVLVRVINVGPAQLTVSQGSDTVQVIPFGEHRDVQLLRESVDPKVRLLDMNVPPGRPPREIRQTAIRFADGVDRWVMVVWNSGSSISASAAAAHPSAARIRFFVPDDLSAYRIHVAPPEVPTSRETELFGRPGGFSRGFTPHLFWPAGTPVRFRAVDRPAAAASASAPSTDPIRPEGGSRSLYVLVRLNVGPRFLAFPEL
ncbi:MAG: hypothetical protein MH204_07360 [Fimbriimonadaceae bacterium]|nr:hypothetical protein [Fimbriimonadaceae bacterium]